MNCIGGLEVIQVERLVSYKCIWTVPLFLMGRGVNKDVPYYVPVLGIINSWMMKNTYFSLPLASNRSELFIVIRFFYLPLELN